MLILTRCSMPPACTAVCAHRRPRQPSDLWGCWPTRLEWRALTPALTINADGQSAINNEHVLELPPMGTPPFNKPTIPSVEGGHSDVPEWWHTISAYVEGELWP